MYTLKETPKHYQLKKKKKTTISSESISVDTDDDFSSNSNTTDPLAPLESNFQPLNPNNEKKINFLELNQILQHHYENNGKNSTINFFAGNILSGHAYQLHNIAFNMGDLLNKSGYSSVLDDIDFTKLPTYIYFHLKKYFAYTQMKFTRCKLPYTAKFQECVFDDCTFFSETGEFNATNCLFINNGDVSKKTYDDKYGNIQLNINIQNPVIVVVYFKLHGTTYTDSIINILEKKHLFTVVKLNENFVTHPLLSLNSNLNPSGFIDGIVLPGGANVITDPKNYTQREKLETLLLQFSLQYQIPTLGVCRGHQFIGSYFGAEVKNITQHSEDIIHVPRNNSSKLFDMTEKKFESQTRKRKRVEIEKEDAGYRYKSCCAHKQGLFFKEPLPPEKKLKIAATADDGIPECLEIGDHIITFQHHHEDDNSKSVSKAALRIFMGMVNDYHDKKIGDQEFDPLMIHL